MPRYEIQPGDTLTSIARKLGVSFDYLLQKNNFNTDCSGHGLKYIYY